MRVAAGLVSGAEARAGSLMRPLLGGGTRLMLSLHHRISDDIDLFIRDPQWIGYLTPRLDQTAEELVDGYEENAVSLKLRLGVGEIDFIVAMSLLDLPAQTMAGVMFDLEPMAEVLAKKLFYRGALLTPRDLFDWWAITSMAPSEVPEPQMAGLLMGRLDGIEAALQAMRSSRAAQQIWSELRAPDKPPLSAAVDFGLERAASYR